MENRRQPRGPCLAICGPVSSLIRRLLMRNGVLVLGLVAVMHAGDAARANRAPGARRRERHRDHARGDPAEGAGPLRRLSKAARRACVPAERHRQRLLRDRQSRARPGHRQDHAEDLVGQHETGLGLGPGRLHGQPDRPSVSGQQLLQHRTGQRPELLGVGGPDRVRQRHVGVLRGNQQGLAERSNQHDARRHRAWRDVPPHGVAGA